MEIWLLINKGVFHIAAVTGIKTGLRHTVMATEIGLIPVSYTHLDVYKRQYMYWSNRPADVVGDGQAIRNVRCV